MELLQSRTSRLKSSLSSCKLWQVVVLVLNLTDIQQGVVFLGLAVPKVVPALNPAGEGTH